MPRPLKQRRCQQYNGDTLYKPRSIPMTELDVISLDLSELEAMRLCDLDGLDQEEAGRRMGVSRGTVQRMLKQGRAAVVEALLTSQALLIKKGNHCEDLHTD
jgi:predicted DNA-binding protein (UPF0251 family)